MNEAGLHVIEACRPLHFYGLLAKIVFSSLFTSQIEYSIRSRFKKGGRLHGPFYLQRVIFVDLEKGDKRMSVIAIRTSFLANFWQIRRFYKSE